MLQQKRHRKETRIESFFGSRALAVGCCAVLLAMSVTACSKETTSTESTNAQTNDSSSQTSSAINIGKVTAIDGKQITLALGDMPGGRMGGRSGDGTAPSGVPEGAPSGDLPDGAAPSGMPEGGPGGDKPDGAIPSGGPQPNGEDGGQMPDGGKGGGFVETGESLIITIEDESIIKLQSKDSLTAGTLSDISVDSILTVEYAEDGSLSSVTIQNTDMGAAPTTEN